MKKKESSIFGRDQKVKRIDLKECITNSTGLFPISPI
jgi:hypothetical protein